MTHALSPEALYKAAGSMARMTSSPMGNSTGASTGTAAGPLGGVPSLGRSSFRAPPMGTAPAGPVSPQRPHVTPARPDAARDMAQAAHEENAAAGIAPQPPPASQPASQPAGALAGTPGAPPGPASSPPVPQPMHPDGRYGHLHAMGHRPTKTAFDAREVRRRVAEVIKSADGVGETNRGNGETIHGVTGTKYGKYETEHSAVGTKQAGAA
jgi:hypothetical protein